jgi:hypothetical protein
MSNGATIKYKAEEVELTAGDAGKVLIACDFPLKNARQVADVIVQRAGIKSSHQSIQLSLFFLE